MIQLWQQVKERTDLEWVKGKNLTEELMTKERGESRKVLLKNVNNG